MHAETAATRLASGQVYKDLIQIHACVHIEALIPKPRTPKLMHVVIFHPTVCVCFLAVAGDVNVTPDGSKQEQQQGLKQTMTSALPAC